MVEITIPFDIPYVDIVNIEINKEKGIIIVSISNLMVNWKNTIIPYCELQHQ